MDKKEIDYRTVPEEGAPISLKKVVDNIKIDELLVLVDNSASGFVNDANLVNVTIEEREKQADYFLGLNLPLPPYLKKYLKFVYSIEDDSEMESMYKHANTNVEMKQLIGFIQLIAGSLNLARKMKRGVRIYIEEPETRLHPKRERMIMSLLEEIKKDYGYKTQE